MDLRQSIRSSYQATEFKMDRLRLLLKLYSLGYLYTFFRSALFFVRCSYVFFHPALLFFIHLTVIGITATATWEAPGKRRSGGRSGPARPDGALTNQPPEHQWVGHHIPEKPASLAAKLGL